MLNYRICRTVRLCRPWSAYCMSSVTNRMITLNPFLQPAFGIEHMNSPRVQAQTQNRRSAIYTFFPFTNCWDYRGQDRLLDSIRCSGGVSHSRTHKHLCTAELSSPNFGSNSPSPPPEMQLLRCLGSFFFFGGGGVNTCGISKQERVSAPDRLITAPHLKFVSSVK